MRKKLIIISSIILIIISVLLLMNNNIFNIASNTINKIIGNNLKAASEEELTMRTRCFI